MDDFGINEMLEMQKTLQDKYQDNGNTFVKSCHTDDNYSV